jgi:hypothetical protein
VTAWIAKEQAAGNMMDITEWAAADIRSNHISGSSTSSSGDDGGARRHDGPPAIVVSPVVAADKPDSKDKRICHNLSYDFGDGSVNDFTSFVNMEPFETARVAQLGRRIVYLKTTLPTDSVIVASRCDLASCFRQFPLRRADWWALGLQHNGRVFGHRVVIWGSRSAAHIAAMISNAVADVIRQRGVAPFTYIDDFIFIGTVEEVERSIAIFREVIAQLGLVENVDKFVSPSTSIVALGVQLDLVNGTIGVTPKRRESLRRVIESMVQSTSATVREAEARSLIGKLTFIAAVIPWSRPRLFILWRWLASLPSTSDTLVVHPEPRYALSWFLARLVEDRLSIDLMAWRRLEKPVPIVTGVATDASDLGFGGYCLASRCFIRGQWNESELQRSINYRELFTIVMAVAAFATSLSGRIVRIDCDNMAAVCAVSHGGANNDSLRVLVSMLCVLQEHIRSMVFVTHLAGCRNGLADALSRQLFPEVWLREQSVSGIAWHHTAVPSAARNASMSELHHFFAASPVADGRLSPLESLTGIHSLTRGVEPMSTRCLPLMQTVCPWTLLGL